MLLAIDTSTSYASIALVRDGRTVAEMDWEVGQRHSTELLECIQWLLTSRALSMETITALAVATGPGSFNGIRVALTTAKTLAFALRVPLYGVPTLDVIAWGAAIAQGPLWAILEAGRGQVYAAQYAAPAASAAGWGPFDGYAILTPAELAARMEQPALVCGEWRDETRAALEQALGERVRFRSRTEARRASWLAELALGRATTGAADDPATLEPLYLRRPAITTSTKLTVQYTQDDRVEPQRPELGGEEASRALRR